MQQSYVAICLISTRKVPRHGLDFRVTASLKSQCKSRIFRMHSIFVYFVAVSGCTKISCIRKDGGSQGCENLVRTKYSGFTEVSDNGDGGPKGLASVDVTAGARRTTCIATRKLVLNKDSVRYKRMFRDWKFTCQSFSSFKSRCNFVVKVLTPFRQLSAW